MRLFRLMKLFRSKISKKHLQNGFSWDTVVELRDTHTECVETQLATSPLPLESSSVASNRALIAALACTVVFSFLCGFWLSIHGFSMQILTLMLITCSVVSLYLSILMAAKSCMQGTEERFNDVSGISEFTEYVVSSTCEVDVADYAVDMVHV